MICFLTSLNTAFKMNLFLFFKLSINAFDYNCHLDLIKLLRQEGELVKLRRARQKMSELFPLTEGTEHPLLSTGAGCFSSEIKYLGQFSAPSTRECDPELSKILLKIL